MQDTQFLHRPHSKNVWETLFQDIRLIFPTSKTVSYTHLDVYKRQVKGIKISSYLDAVGIDSKNPYAPRKAVPKIVELINRIIELNADTDAGADLRRTAIVHEIFGEIMRYRCV